MRYSTMPEQLINGGGEMKDMEFYIKILENERQKDERIRHIRRLKERQRQKEQYNRDKKLIKIATVCGILLLVVLITIIDVRQRRTNTEEPAKLKEIAMVKPSMDVRDSFGDFEVSDDGYASTNIRVNIPINNVGAVPRQGFDSYNRETLEEHPNIE